MTFDPEKYLRDLVEKNSLLIHEEHCHDRHGYQCFVLSKKENVLLSGALSFSNIESVVNDEKGMKNLINTRFENLLAGLNEHVK